MKRFLHRTLAVASLLALAAAQSAPARPRRDTAPDAVPVLTGSSAPQAIRASANYSLASETTDLGGGSVLTSAAYSVSGTAVGQPSAASVGTSPAYTVKPGFVGQLYDVRGLGVYGVGTNNVNERATLQLAVAPKLDDGTLLAVLDPGAVAWSVVGGPLTAVSTTGLATASTVYQNTPATVRVTLDSLSGTGVVIVVNVSLDDYGSYAGDGIDDAWQAQYFGLNNPLAGPTVDADGTGQTNLLKYLAGLNPLNPSSRFTLMISAVAAQPNQKTLTFAPVYSGRTYTVQYTGSLTPPNWTTLTAYPNKPAAR